VIVVKVELHSAIDGRVENLGSVVIWNDGTGDRTTGNYKAVSLRKGADVYQSLRRYFRDNRKAAVREGSVKGHKRLNRPVLELVRKALEDMGY
jgi:hypothetical protein